MWSGRESGKVHYCENDILPPLEPCSSTKMVAHVMFWDMFILSVSLWNWSWPLALKWMNHTRQPINEQIPMWPPGDMFKWVLLTTEDVYSRLRSCYTNFQWCFVFGVTCISSVTLHSFIRPFVCHMLVGCCIVSLQSKG